MYSSEHSPGENYQAITFWVTSLFLSHELADARIL